LFESSVKLKGYKISKSYYEEYDAFESSVKLRGFKTQRYLKVVFKKITEIVFKNNSKRSCLND